MILYKNTNFNFYFCYTFFLKVYYIMSISNFFSSIFGKTNKRKRPRNKQNIKTRHNKKRRVRFMKGAMKGG